MTASAAGTTEASDRGGVALVVLSTLAYGLAPSMARLAYDSGVTVMTATAGRFVAGACGIALLWWLRGAGFRLSRRAAWGAIGCGLISSITSTGYMAALARIPASLAVLIFFTFPVLVGIAARLIDGVPLTATKLGSLLLAFAGVAMAVGVDLDRLDLVGVACAGAAAVGAAAHVMVVSKVVRWAGATLPVNLRSMLVGMVVSSGLLAALGGPVWPAAPIGWLGFVGTALFFTLGMSLMYAGVARLGPVRTAVVQNLEPINAILAAVVILGERLGPQQVLGAAMVLGAVAWLQLRRSG